MTHIQSPFRHPIPDARGRRPDLGPGLVQMTWELAEASPDSMGHVDPRAILFVAGSARREARASVRPFAFGGPPALRTSPDGRWRKPEVTIAGQEILYEICLRPLFFLASNPTERARTLVHELLHVSTRFDGTLDPDRSHRAASGGALEAEVNKIVAAWHSKTGPTAASWLAYQGEAELNAWLCRPPSRAPKDARIRWAYDERDLYPAVIMQKGDAA